jgi:4-amino-4-deoxy-L-arabinose transferase-like glycosyltransferase
VTAGGARDPASSAAPGAARGARPGDRLLPLVALGIAVGLIVSFALVHVDDADGVVYTVVARNLAQDGRLFDLRFLPEIFPHFREHPPFFFWIWALAIRIGSEQALPWIGAACGLATLGIAYALAKELCGRRSAFLGALALATIESFFRYQARARLDPPLTLLFTASVALLVAARGRTLWVFGGGLAAGLGALVKGPPALGAPVAAVLALLALGRSAELRRARWWLLALGPALALPAAFLLYDHFALAGTWWKGYVEDQFLASALGLRHDGAGERIFLLRSVLGRLGPWSALLALGLVRAVRERITPRARATWALLAWAAVVVGGYSMAGRAWWHYAMPAYVPLALAAGLGLDDLLGWAGDRTFRAFRAFAAAAAFLLVVALPFRLARFVVKPCILGELPVLASPPPPGTRVGLAADRLALVEAGILAEHARLEAVPLRSPAELAAAQGAIAMALADARWPVPSGWERVATQGPWMELRRRAPTPAASPPPSAAAAAPQH